MWKLSGKIAFDVCSCGYSPDVIVAVVRGGLVPAMNLSDMLDVKDIFFVRVVHWSETAKKNERAILKTPLCDDVKEKNVLLVDDVADSGESIKTAYEHVSSRGAAKVKTATLVYKKQSKIKPDFWGEKTDDWRWIIFPWNTTEDLCNLIRRVSDESGVDVDVLMHKLKQEYNLFVDVKLLDFVLNLQDKRNSCRNHVRE